MSAPTLAVPGSQQRGTQTESEARVQQQDIANLAYALWQQRGCPHGSAEQDWIEAERQLLERQSQTLTRR